MDEHELGILQHYGLGIFYCGLIIYGLFIHYLQQTYGYPCE